MLSHGFPTLPQHDQSYPACTSVVQVPHAMIFTRYTAWHTSASQGRVRNLLYAFEKAKLPSMHALHKAVRDDKSKTVSDGEILQAFSTTSGSKILS